jgi:hypothetical protein
MATKGAILFNTDQTTMVNPATDETLQLLRRMVKLMESNSTVDSANRQRVVVENSITVGTAPTTAVTLASAPTTAVTIGGQAVDIRFEHMDRSHQAYSMSIRDKLAFS